MARTLNESPLTSSAARGKLKASAKPYWRQIDADVHLGYRKGRTGGRWCVRRYLGAARYAVETIGTADDQRDADGSAVLNYEQAKRLALKRAVELDAGKTVRPYTVRNALDDYVTHLDGLGKASAYDVRLRLKACVPDSLGDLPLAKVTTGDLTTWHHAMAKVAARKRTKAGKEQQYRPKARDAESIRQRKVSANRVLASVKAALNHALQSDKVASDTAWKRVKPFAKVDTARSAYLQLVECQRLVNAAQGDFRQLVRAGLETGCRFGELTRLLVEDFNPDSGTLHVRLAKSGKGRHVVLTDDGVKFFRQLTVGRAGSEIMLRRGDREFKRSEQTIPMIEACKRAGLTPLGFHQLRHTWASHAVMSGTPLLVVARNLGHADTRMVERHYGHLAPSFITDALRSGAPRYGIAAEPSNVEVIR